MSENENAELAAALAGASEDPGNDAAWDRVEALASTLDDPDPAAGAYRSVLAGDLDPSVAVAVGKRAARFHEEWFGDDPNGLADVLTRVIELEPKSEWAFQRLTVVLSVAERWDDVLALYDRSLAAASTKARRIKLLDEAYQVAKDLADEPNRAIDYLKAKLELKPNVKQTQALERLLERHERYRDLIELWRAQLGDGGAKDRAATLQRIATCWFDDLGDPRQALETTRELLGELDADTDGDACALLERIATAEGTPADVRDDALDLMRQHYEASDRPRDIVRVLEVVLPLGDDAARRRLHGELGERLSALEEHDAALDHYAVLLRIDPSSTATQRALRREAQLTDGFDRYAAALSAAAEVAGDTARVVALLADAARTRRELCDDEPGAIELLQRALGQDGIAPADVLTVGRRLEDLLARAERHAERLDVLERLADAESVASSRTALIGDAARLAEQIGEIDRALAAWRRRLDGDAGDLRALEALIQLLEREQRWDELIEALQRRIAADVPASQKRSDRVRVASVLENELEREDAALDAWRQVQSEHGDDTETVTALSRLLSSLGRWNELAELLEVSNQKQIDSLADQLARLGDAYRESMDDSARALDCYRRALTVDPRHEGARAGLAGLAEREDSRNAAAEALVHTCRATGDLAGLLELVEPRLAGSDDPRRHAEILREAADIAENTVGDRERALGYVARLLPLTPRDRVLEDRLVRLARGGERWDEVFAAFAGAAEALEGDTHALAELRFREGGLREGDAGDRDGALSAYRAVVALQPGNLAAVTAVARLAGAAGRWDEVAGALLAYVVDRDHIPEGVLAEARSAADDGDALAAWVGALTAALAGTDLPSRHAAELSWRVAGWQRDALDDADAAEAALLVAAERDKNRVDVHQALAALQRRHPDAALHTTLLRLTELEPDDLDVFAEAAELADAELDAETAEQSLTALLSRASAAWKGTAPARGDRDPAQLVAHAVDRLVERALARDAGDAALDLLLEAARLPFDDATRLALRNRAAHIAGEVLGDREAAIEMYRSVLAQAPDDEAALAALGALYTETGRLPELLSLRRHELAQSPSAERRTALRLEIAQLLDDIERACARLDLLRANLDDQPGHGASIDAIAAHLRRLGQHSELLGLLTEQAHRLEDGSAARAAELWAEVATIAEEDLRDVDRALEAHRKVAALAPTLHALDSLARLYIERGQHGAAVPWLEEAMTQVSYAERPTLVLRLAKAHIAAGHPAEAIEVLDRELEQRDEPMLPLRELVASLHREASSWQALADVLTASLPHIDDDEAVAAAAREAADIYHGRLEMPAAAVPALQKALELVPDDRQLRVMMARSLRAAERLDEAQAVLEALIAEFGRRRSKERAGVHVELAQVARQQGRLDAAMSELELASKMDVGNAQILKTLAELSREQGELEQAERSLRALLLVVRRQPPGDDASEVGISEVLYELHHVAAARDDEDKASELLESVREAATSSDVEVLRLRRTLLAHGQHELLADILSARLAQAGDGELAPTLHGHLADLQENQFDDPQAALGSRLAALELAPEDGALHDRARVLAGQLGRVADYLACLERIVSGLRREEEASLAAALLLRAGQVAESELDDRNKARELYEQVQSFDDSSSEALSALARVCAALGDTEAQAEALDQLATLAMAGGPTAIQAGALYELAALQADTPSLVPRCLEVLNQALEVEPRYRDAGLILRRAAEATGDDAAVLAAYEPVARAGSDRGVLLDYLERRARAGDAEPARIREAVDLARELGELHRAADLLGRAVEAARSSDEGLAGSVWAATALAQVRADEGALAEARDLVFEVAHLVADDEILELGLAIAGRGAEDERTLALAAEVYEHLREREPRRRDVWEPLLAVYRRLGDGDRLSQLVDATLPTLMEAADRNALRSEKARFLVDVDRDADAIECLRDALLDDPDDLGAAALLEEILGKDGNEEALADFLWQRFEDARERRAVETTIDVAHRLGRLLDRIGSGDPLAVYRQALEVAPDSRALLEAVLAHLPGDAEPAERAGLLERLLAVAEGDEAPTLALELAGLREQAGDAGGVQRALELGQSLAPTDPTLRDRLDTWYRETNQWQPLAAMMVSEAEATEDDARAVARLREAASLYQDYLADLDTAAAVLGVARGRAPRDAALVSDLAACHAAAGNRDGAIDSLTAALGEIDGAERLPLLMMRADLLSQSGRPHEAIADLDEAYGLDPAEVQPMLAASLEEQRAAAREQMDIETERTATLRLVELRRAHGDGEGARTLLLGWVERAPTDVEALHLLRDLDSAAERWDGVIAACSRLVEVEEGAEQLATALQLADAADKAGSPALALGGLQTTHRAQPDEGRVRDLLRALYEQTGATRDLADLLLVDAEHADDDDGRYELLRSAADLYVNHLDDAAAAIEPAQKAKELRPDDHATQVLLADVLIGSGQLDQAIAMLEPAIGEHKRRSPELASLQYRMAKVAAAQNDKDEQLGWLKKAFDVDRKDGFIASELAHLATELGDYDLALKPLRAITLMDTPGPVSRVMALLWEAKIEHARGNRAKAELWAKKALREDPSYAEAEEFLETISE